MDFSLVGTVIIVFIAAYIFEIEKEKVRKEIVVEDE